MFKYFISTFRGGGGQTKIAYFAYVVRGVGGQRENAYVKDLNSYPPEKVF